jgi:hypothetical protein
MSSLSLPDAFSGKVKKEEKKKQIEMNPTQEDIGHGHKPAGQVEVEQREVEKGQESIRRELRSLSHKTMAGWGGEWELYNHCLQARQLQHEQTVSGGTGQVHMQCGPRHH